MVSRAYCTALLKHVNKAKKSSNRILMLSHAANTFSAFPSFLSPGSLDIPRVALLWLTLALVCSQIVKHRVAPGQTDKYKQLIGQYYGSITDKNIGIKHIGSWECVVGELDTFGASPILLCLFKK